MTIWDKIELAVQDKKLTWNAWQDFGQKWVKFARKAIREHHVQASSFGLNKIFVPNFQHILMKSNQPHMCRIIRKQ